MAEVLPKVTEIRDKLGTGQRLEIDGGIGPDTVQEAARAGADTFVAGCSIFGAPDPVAAMDIIRERASAGARIRLGQNV